jgi:alanine dehydrogenase
LTRRPLSQEHPVVLYLGRRDVEQLLETGPLLDALALGMADLSAGRASAPPRVGARVADRDGVLGAMPGYSPALGVLAAKLVTVFPHNTDRPTHQALIAAFDPVTGEPVAVLDGEAITAARTAAGSALSVRLLARRDARVLAVLGAGVQARSHALAVSAVRPLEEVRVAGRTPARVEALVADLVARGLPARGAASWQEACAGADLVCATTSSPEPVVRREWLSPGVHVTSVGSTAGGREVDDATVADALVVVESRDTVVRPYPTGTADVAAPVAGGLLDLADVVEIGELVDGRRPGRTSAGQLTLYKSVGVAVQDVAAVALVLRAARERGLGRQLDL